MKFFLAPLILLIIGFLLRDSYLTISIYDTYYLISYFVLSLFLVVLYFSFLLLRKFKQQKNNLM
jgi:hypothetical protein